MAGGKAMVGVREVEGVGLDETDRSLLEELEGDASQTKKQLARKLRLPLTTVFNRVQRLERTGVIRGYRAVVDPKKVGRSVAALVQVTVNYVSKDFSQQDVARKIAQLPDVREVAIVAGEMDLVAKVYVRDTDALSEFITKKLRAIPGVDKTVTLVVLQEFAR